MRLDFHKNHRLLYGVIFFGFIALTFIIAIGPAIWVNDHNAPLPTSQPLTDQEQAGLRVYVGEGCLYCHTQQVRPLDEDQPYGRPAVPGDYARLHWQDAWRGVPMILGTERTGPDLSNVATRQPSETWQYMHLYQPRSVVPGSVMPAFPWLFTVEKNPGPNAVIVPVPDPYAPKDGKVVATPRAQALVAYLLALKQPPLTGTQASAPAAATTPSAPGGGGGSAAGGASGATVYSNICVSCHQPSGEGLKGAFPPLVGDPVVTASDATEHIRTVLFGLHGKAIAGVSYATVMPPWGDQLSDAQVAAVVNHERTSWGNNAPTVTEADVAAVRKAGPNGAGGDHE